MSEPAQSPALLSLYSVYSDRVHFAGFAYGATREWRRWLVYRYTMEWWKENGEPTAIGIPVDDKGYPTDGEASCVAL